MRLDHTMLRVSDLDQSVRFYKDVLLMKEIRRKDYEWGKFTLVFMGYEEDGHLIELTYNWDGRSYELGTGYGHVAVIVDDIHHLCDQVKSKGGNVTREPGPMKGSSSQIAFIEDPDGYKIELIQKGSA
ncbi:MAG: Lactoylglutathione lyase [Chlamydiia bacterium]|nr:Lactoylglutathione lyase [Chlamydiia bacterium]MCH9616040.1 Lactoylglutathione lyase [Chlamydiia bacterium]MCH9629063.1 Lactoylglutathione lyase [Chlamydiia bacterium]